MTFHFAMMTNYAIYRKLLMRRLADTGLTAGQPKILDYLIDHDGESQGEIAAANLIEPASMTTLINGMEKKGLVERRRIGNDRRSYHIFLTENGKEMCRRIMEAFDAMEDETFSDPKEREEFQNVLEEIHNRLVAMLEETEN